MIRWFLYLGGTFSLVACASVVTDGSRSASIFYRTQAEADVALQKFDNENPKCELWTNWQKMCSRTGINGRTECVIDPDYVVRPSTPFCAEASIPDRVRFRQSEQFFSAKSLEFRSRQRYCKFDGKTLYCANERPFNGSHLSARRHRLCEIWSLEHAPDFEPLCVEGSTKFGLSKCDDVAKVSRVNRSKLYCSKPKRSEERNLCASIVGWGDGPDFGQSGPYDVVPMGRKGELAVIGLHCE